MRSVNKRSTGQQALAIANYSDGPVTLTARLANGQTMTRFRTIDHASWTPLAADEPFPLAARSALVLLP